MKTFFTSIIFLLLLSTSIFSQINKINTYKYVIVPEKFDFLKSADQYQTSSLTKFLLEKNGLIVILGDKQFPKDLLLNRCLALKVNLVEESNMFSVKTSIEFKDCLDKVIYTTQIGKSKEKEYKKAYQEAIRNAHNTMANFTYSYQPLQEEPIVDRVEASATIPVNKEVPVTVLPPVNTITSNGTIADATATKILYAQTIDNGFQLVDTHPAVVFQVINTNLKDVFIIKDKNGILYKNNGKWVAQYYNKTVLVEEAYTIKF